MVPEVLSQAEIDALLQALSSGHVDIEAIKKSEEEKKFKVYDFRRPDKFSKDQLRAIQMVHESFARQVTRPFPRWRALWSQPRWLRWIRYPTTNLCARSSNRL